jgi:hypothetical protein
LANRVAIEPPSYVLCSHGAHKVQWINAAPDACPKATRSADEPSLSLTNHHDFAEVTPSTKHHISGLKPMPHELFGHLTRYAGNAGQIDPSGNHVLRHDNWDAIVAVVACLELTAKRAGL